MLLSNGAYTMQARMDIKYSFCYNIKGKGKGSGL